MQVNLIKYDNIGDAKSYAYSQIDIEAGNARARYITIVPGQSETYQEKATDAAAYANAGYPEDATPYPWVHAEAQATGMTAQQAADNILATKAGWLALGTAIEGLRIGGKASVAAASTQTEVLSIMRSTISSLKAI